MTRRTYLHPKVIRKAAPIVHSVMKKEGGYYLQTKVRLGLIDPRHHGKHDTLLTGKAIGEELYKAFVAQARENAKTFKEVK